MLILRVYFDINYFGYIDCRKCFDNGDDNSNDETEQDEAGEEEISVQELEVLINAAIKKKQAKEVSYSTNALLWSISAHFDDVKWVNTLKTN